MPKTTDLKKEYTFNALATYAEQLTGNVQVTVKGNQAFLEGYTRFGSVGFHVNAEKYLSDVIGSMLRKRYPKTDFESLTVNVIDVGTKSITGDSYLTKKCLKFRIKMEVEEATLVDDREAIFIYTSDYNQALKESNKK